MRIRPRGRRREPGKMNRLEARYAEHLRARQIDGEVVWFAFEAWRFRLADRTYYNPDFAVQLADGTLEAHEVKGFWEDDARVKVKVAAEMHPVLFVAVRWVKGCWEYERFG